MSIRNLIRFRRSISSGLVAGAILFLSGCGQQSDSQVAEAEAVSAAQVRRSVAVRERSGEAAGEAFGASSNVESKLPIYEIRMQPEDLATMEQNPRSEDLYPATFRAEGVVYENVKIRYRGAWARTWPKKPLKIFFYNAKPFKGQRRLNLNSSFRDPSFIRETLAYHIYERAGSPSPKSQLARVHLNGSFHGIYVQVEQPDKTFLKRFDLKDAIVMKAISRMKQGDERAHGPAEAYQMHYEQETEKEEDGFVLLKQFCDELAQSSDALEFFKKNVDLEKYINYLAATTLCQNWDGYNKNHLLIHDGRDSKKWIVVPWDLDRALGDHWDWSFGQADLPIELGTEEKPGVTGWNRLQDKFMSHPELRARLGDRLEQLLEKEFTIEKLGPVIDELHASVAAEASLDYRRWPNEQSHPWWRNDKIPLEESVNGVKQFIKDRGAYLLSELPRLRGNSKAQQASSSAL